MPTQLSPQLSYTFQAPYSPIAHVNYYVEFKYLDEAGDVVTSYVVLYSGPDFGSNGPESVEAQYDALFGHEVQYYEMYFDDNSYVRLHRSRWVSTELKYEMRSYNLTENV